MNAIVLQSGGPTAVINASLAGVIENWWRDSPGKRIWGARHGWRGMVSGDWVDLTDLSVEQVSLLERQPGAALGAGRDRLDEENLPALLDRLKQREIGAVIVIGGNGSMAAAHRLNEAAGGSIRVVGVPKTIDNDLTGTGLCPGYPSAARWVAVATRDAGLDLVSMKEFDDVAVIEVMGRHTGWIAAASALARWKAGTPPDLILLPEAPFDEDAFLAAVRKTYAARGVCLVVAAEGVKDAAGTYLAEKGQSVERDASGQKLLALAGGPAPYLAGLIRDRLKRRCRQMRPDTIQRSSSAAVSPVDRALAGRVGADAVSAAGEGASGVMIGLERTGAEWRAIRVPFDRVLARERPLPSEFIDAANFDVTPAFIDYAKPLIGDWNPEAIIL